MKYILYILILIAPVVQGQIIKNFPTKNQHDQPFDLWDTTASKTALNARTANMGLWEGHMTYVQDIDSFYVYTGSVWKNLDNFISSGVGSDTSQVTYGIIGVDSIMLDTLVNKWYVDSLIYGKEELIARDIYVETTGNDITGDGSIGSPFATFNRALLGIGKYIKADITVHFGLGSFEYTVADKQLLDKKVIMGDAQLLIPGTFTDELTGFTLTPDALNPFLYTMSGQTMTPAEYMYGFLKKGTKYYPVMSNTATQFETFQNLSAGTHLYNIGTTFTNPDNSTGLLNFFTLSDKETSLEFQTIIFSSTVDFDIQQSNIVNLRWCRLTETLDLEEHARFFIKFSHVTEFLSDAANSFYQQCRFYNTGNYVAYVKRGNHVFRGALFEGSGTNTGLRVVDGVAFNNNTSSNKDRGFYFKNLGNALYLDNATFNGKAQNPTYLNNVDYLIKSDNYADLSLSLEGLINEPDLSIRADADTTYSDLDKNLFINFNQEIFTKVSNINITNSITLKDSTVNEMFSGVIPDTTWVNEKISESGGGSSNDSSLASSTDTIILIQDTLQALQVNAQFKTVSIGDSIQLPDGTWIYGSTTAGSSNDSSLASSTNTITLIQDTLLAKNVNYIVKTISILDSLQLPDSTWIVGADISSPDSSHWSRNGTVLSPAISGDDVAINGNVGIGITTPTALLHLSPATTSNSQLRLESSSGTNPSSPNSGDMWFNGTNLNFYNGSSTTDLLAGGSSYTFENGLTETSGTVRLGGTLSQATTIEMDGHDLIFNTASGDVEKFEIYASAGTQDFTFSVDNANGIVSNFGGMSGTWGSKVTSTDARLYAGASQQNYIAINQSAMTVTDGLNSKGLVYGVDYSANYTDRSIPDIAAVRAEIHDSISGLGSPTYGSSTQIPFMNIAGDDFLYDAGLVFSGVDNRLSMTNGHSIRVGNSGSSYPYLWLRQPSSVEIRYEGASGYWNYGLTATNGSAVMSFGHYGNGTSYTYAYIGASIASHCARFISTGAVSLYHNSNLKFETQSTGINVTGTAVTDGVTIDGVLHLAPQSAPPSSPSNGDMYYGADGDLHLRTAGAWYTVDLTVE